MTASVREIRGRQFLKLRVNRSDMLSSEQVAEILRLRTEERKSLTEICKLVGGSTRDRVRKVLALYPLSPDDLRAKTRPRLSREPVEVACQKCSRIYVWSRDDRAGHSKSVCNSCLVNSRRPLLKRRAIEYKGGKCEVCAYSKCVRALAFHHTDPTRKDFQISARMTSAWDVIVKELDKCVLLCANCHAEAHDGLIDLSTYHLTVQDGRSISGS